MTYQKLTGLVFRFGGVLLLIKFFELYGYYFLASYYVATSAQENPKTYSAVHYIYDSGIFLMCLNISLSFILLLKADWLAAKLIKTDTNLQIGLTYETLVKAILFVTGLVWLIDEIIMLPEIFDYIFHFARRDADYLGKHNDFRISRHLIQLVFALLLLFANKRILKLINRDNVNNAISVEGQETSTNA